MSVPLQDANGVLWDAGGLPDPSVGLYIDDEIVGGTGTVMNATGEVTVAAPQTVRALVTASSKISIWIVDDDFVDGYESVEYIDGVVFTDPIWAVRRGGESGPLYSGSTSSLTFTITPIP